jgi:hypothetical protein
MPSAGRSSERSIRCMCNIRGRGRRSAKPAKIALEAGERALKVVPMHVEASSPSLYANKNNLRCQFSSMALCVPWSVRGISAPRSSGRRRLGGIPASFRAKPVGGIQPVMEK